MVVGVKKDVEDMQIFATPLSDLVSDMSRSQMPRLFKTLFWQRNRFDCRHFKI